MAAQEHLEDAVYEAARHLPPVHRPSYLLKACGSNTELLQRVQQRLAAPAQMAGNTTIDSEETVDSTLLSSGALPRGAEESPGDWIGRYQIVEKIGEGGFGVVYLAEQREPVMRRVALKITKLGMDTKQVIGRFEGERQALALMNHPNIANVIDGGATETGRPFFVMEYVKGMRITDYCNENKVPLRKRLAMFVQVCQAIQHAHQNGIIHRDIKPSNILVTLHDGEPVCKVIDFGIAKATQGTLTDKTVFTQFDQFIGTPAYMSPEQTELNGSELDGRADIYSLGVLLYELLTGHPPFESKGLLARGFDEMRRIIREIEPLRPSNRLGKESREALKSKAGLHDTDAPKLISLIKGDLDWVVMKCLEKDRDRRYASAAELSLEIQRFLADEPVEARPPSYFYRFQKLMIRNQLAFATGTVFFTSLLVGLCIMTYYVIKEKDALDLADNASKTTESARQNAEAARFKAQEALRLSEKERQTAEAATKAARDALAQSEADRASALAAQKRAEEALRQSEESKREASAANQKAASSEFQAQVAETRATTEAGKSEEALKTAATEAELRRRAEADAAAAEARATRLDTTLSNFIARLDSMTPADGLKVASVLLPREDEAQAWAAPILRQRGQWRAATGDWTNAAHDWTQALALEQQNVPLYEELAAVRAQLDDWNGYTNLRAQYLDRVHPSALSAAWLLKPWPGDATNASAIPPGDSLFAQALADYRQGNFTQSLDLTQKVAIETTNDLGLAAQAGVVLAMDRAQLKKWDEARTSYANAEKIAEPGLARLTNSDPGPDWREWIVARALLQEAAGLMPGNASTNQP